MNPKWPSTEKPVGGAGKGGWPSVEAPIGKGTGPSDSAKDSSLARNHPLDGKKFNKSRPQK